MAGRLIQCPNRGCTWEQHHGDPRPRPQGPRQAPQDLQGRPVMSHDTYPTDRNRTDAVLDHLIVVQAENVGLVDRCAELIDIADAACDARDASEAALTVLRRRAAPHVESGPF